MLDIWMSSIARAGGIEVPPNRFIVEPKAYPVPQSEPLPQPQAEGRFLKLARWLQARLTPPAKRCEV